jgi:hypothetical protein
LITAGGYRTSKCTAVIILLQRSPMLGYYSGEAQRWEY